MKKLKSEIHECCSICQESSRTDVGHIWDLVVREWHGTHASKPNGERNQIDEVMMLNFAEGGHTVFRATSALVRRELKKQRRWEEVHSLQRK